MNEQTKSLIEQAREKKVREIRYNFKKVSDDDFRMLSFKDCMEKFDLYEKAYMESEVKYQLACKELLKVIESINVLQNTLIELEALMKFKNTEGE